MSFNLNNIGLSINFYGVRGIRTPDLPTVQSFTMAALPTRHALFLLQIISHLNTLIVIPKTTCQAIKRLLEPYRSHAKLSSAKDINGGAHKGTYVLNAAS
jgi:hypothetical protein